MVERGSWGSQIHFLVTCIGFAVGLGNLWRFPGLAYEHGGGAFLIPYVIASALIGFPCLYLELCIGQFTRRGPAKCFRYFKPVLQGVGWASAIVAYVVGIYYNMINVFSGIYLIKIISGGAYQFTSCRNDWNTQYCESSMEDALCSEQSNGVLTYYRASECHTEEYRNERLFLVANKSDLSPVSPAEEFFGLYMLEKNDGIEHFDGFNLKLLIGFFLVWAQCCLCLLRGVKWIGRISMVTATFPFVIIGALFVRAITLDGADIGLDFFLLHPDMSYLLKLETWTQAAIQICYTLAIGFGGLLSLSSFNAPTHNCFKDALIVVMFDSFMSLFGGTAVFCTMGFISKQSNQPMGDLVQSGTALAFVAYPEALGRMPLAALWQFLFFLMFFLLGVSSQFGMTEVMCTAICDQWPVLHTRKALVAFLVCASSFILGLPLTTKSGIYWFDLLNAYAGTFALFLVAALEVITVSYLYGIHNFAADLRKMMGFPTTVIGDWFGPSGRLIRFNWTFVAPPILVVLFGLSLSENIGYQITYGKNERLYMYPWWANVVGWAFAVAPLLAIPICAVANIIVYARSEDGVSAAFQIHPKLPSYSRIRDSQVRITDSDLSIVKMDVIQTENGRVGRVRC